MQLNFISVFEKDCTEKHFFICLPSPLWASANPICSRSIPCTTKPYQIRNMTFNYPWTLFGDLNIAALNFWCHITMHALIFKLQNLWDSGQRRCDVASHALFATCDAKMPKERILVVFNRYSTLLVLCSAINNINRNSQLYRK